MAFYPAGCDYNCKGCEKNNGSGWCLFWNHPIATEITRSDNYKATRLCEECLDVSCSFRGKVTVCPMTNASYSTTIIKE